MAFVLPEENFRHSVLHVKDMALSIYEKFKELRQINTENLKSIWREKIQ